MYHLPTVFKVRDILSYLEKNRVVLPSGGELTVGRWQHLGIGLGVNGQSFVYRDITMPKFARIGGINRIHRKFILYWTLSGMRSPSRIGFPHFQRSRVNRKDDV